MINIVKKELESERLLQDIKDKKCNLNFSIFFNIFFE